MPKSWNTASSAATRHKENIHNAQVAKLVTQVQQFYAQHKPFRIYHGSTNSTRILSLNRRTLLDTSKLDKVLKVDTTARTVLVQSNVPMDKLVRATLRYGLVPLVVPEFPGITVGGAIQGGAGESSSFRHGDVSDTINWLEIILADGKLIKASPTQHADLFWGTAGSYGSLGVITSAEVQLIPAKKYVAVTYTPVASFAEAIASSMQATRATNDFVDGILFSGSSGVVITGAMTDQPVGHVRHFRGPHDEWFYLHAQKLSRFDKPTTESMPIMDYLFRYDRGAFWMGKYAFDMFHVPFTHTNRLLLNGLLNTRKLYQALQASGVSQRHIIQDLAMPAANAQVFLEYVDKQFGIYPLWLCPLAVDRRSPLHANYLATNDIINIGVWGPFTGSHNDFIAANRRLEEKVHELGGRKWLYAHTSYSPEAFWNIYDETWYRNLRKTYNALSLPTVYDKVHVEDERQPENVTRGLLKAISGNRTITIK